MKSRISVIFLSIFLFGCTSSLPQNKASFSDFLPKDITKVVSEKSPQIFEENVHETPTFAEKNFPQNCSWRVLERIIDGDTILLNKNEKVRLIGIDTPEVKHPKKPPTKEGVLATKFLRTFFEESTKVCLIFDPISDKKDKYKRTLAYIFNEAGEDINLKILSEKIGDPYLYFPFSRKKEFSAFK